MDFLTLATLKQSFLPKTGGTLTGDIVFYGTDGLKRSSNNASTSIKGGKSAIEGASIQVHGSTSSGHEGEFSLTAHDGTNSASIRGTPTGTLTWNGVSHTAFCLPNYSEYTSLELPASGGSLTAPGDGYILCRGEISEAAFVYFTVDGVRANCFFGSAVGYYLCGFVPVVQGQTVGFIYSGLTSPSAIFVKAKGTS